jgi:hypothetical protein
MLSGAPVVEPPWICAAREMWLNALLGVLLIANIDAAAARQSL